MDFLAHWSNGAKARGGTVFIQTQDTPNPATLKFLPGRVVMEQGTRDFPTVEAAAGSLFALSLFAIGGVRGVFFGSDFITITKDDSVSWSVLKPEILRTMLENFLSGHDAGMGDGRREEAAAGGSASEEVLEIISEIREILDSRVRPAVLADGGDIVFERFEDGVVFVRLQGACSGCPSSTATLKSGVENMLRHYIPEVSEVRAISGEPQI